MASSYPCEGCGSELEWSAQQGQLKCPYCGHVSSGASAAADEPAAERPMVQEHGLETALQTATRGWGTEVREFKCKGCGAISAVEPNATTSECAFCGIQALEVQSGGEDVFRPESLMPFAVDKETAVRDFKKWISGLRWAPGELKGMARLNKISGVYVPVWTFDTKTMSNWNAEAGYYYYVEESYSTTDDSGNTVSKNRKVRKTRWEPASGVLNKTFDDWLVQASKGIEQSLFEGLLPYDTGMLQPYDTKYLSGFIAERYQISLKEGWRVGQKGMGEKIEDECEDQIPGDTHRNLRVSTRWESNTFKHCLLPVWISAYQYNDKTYRYVVNGVTGKLHGTAPKSWFKIIGCILTVLLAVGVVLGLLKFFAG